MPKDTRPPEARKDSAEDVAQRNEIHIERMDCEYVNDLAAWFSSNKVKQNYEPVAKPAAAAPGGQPAAEGARDATGGYHGRRRHDNARRQRRETRLPPDRLVRPDRDG